MLKQIKSERRKKKKGKKDRATQTNQQIDRGIIEFLWWQTNKYKGLKFPLINQMDIIIDEFAEKNDARKNLLCNKFLSMGVQLHKS